MAVFLSPVGGVAAQFFTNTGAVLTGGKLYSYAAGTTTPAATYTSAAGVTFNTNPIVLDAAGRVPSSGEIWLGESVQYKFVLKDSNDVLIATYDNIIGINSNFVNYNVLEEIQTATAGQTVFNLTNSYTPGTNTLSVFVDGVNQYDGSSYSYTETSSTRVTFTAGLHVGALVKFTTAVTLSAGVTSSNLVTYTPPFAGSVETTVDNKFAQYISVTDFGVVGDGTTNNTIALATALNAVPTNGTLYFPAGVYCGYLIVWRGDITIMGAGSASTTLKLPNNCPTITVPHDGPPNPITGLPNVIEIGECALGNAANTYSRVNVIGLTLDGNYSNNTAPTTDLFGHGMILTKTSYCFIDDVVAQNCFLTGIDNVINSNCNTINATCKDCGKALISSSYYPNFDINSSKYGTFNITSINGAYNGRMLDNCWGNTLTLRGSNPTYTGFIYDNQSVNASYANIINVSIVDGCTLGQGVSVGANCFNSQINATLQSVAGAGFYVNGASGTSPTGNIFNINTYQSGTSGVYAGANCSYNKFNIVSKEDGRNGAPGDNFAINFDGADNNQLNVIIQEGAVSQARGLIFQSGANNNHLIDFLFDSNLVQAINDLGIGNYINWPSGSPAAAIASSNIIDIPFAGSLFEISGNIGIVGANTSAVYNGRTITLRFQSNPIVSQKSATPGSNFLLAGSVDFNATAGDTLTLITNGTDWIEIARSVN